VSNRSYTPDRWVLLDFDVDGACTRHVLAGWYGGYLGSDEWRRSSPVGEPERVDGALHFRTASGTRYRCLEHAYGLSSLTASVLGTLKQQAEQAGGSVTVVEPELEACADGE
jgi:hypothetical protein